jgi:outer membrane protein assembly factor BamB
MMYVDTTTASPDSIKYSRQIDVTAKNLNQILKIDPRTGKTLWSRETGGSLAYVSGKYLYTFQGFGFNDDDEESEGLDIAPAFQGKNMVRIRRLNPKNGKEYWEHTQDRLPLHARFDQNRIHLVFKKEVQVLKCGSF